MRTTLGSAGERIPTGRARRLWRFWPGVAALLALKVGLSLLGAQDAQAVEPTYQTATVYHLEIDNGHTWTVISSCSGALTATGYQDMHSPDETITATLSPDGAVLNFESTYIGGWDGSAYNWSGSFPVSGGAGAALRGAAIGGDGVRAFHAAVVTTSSKPCGTSNPNLLGITVPDAARAILSESELVSAICATSRWRAGEMFAAIDATAAAQPAAERALAEAGIAYNLPDPQSFRDRGAAALSAICGATTLDEAIARNQGLIDVNSDMEANYGALSEALGGAIKANVDVIESDVRAQINAFVDDERAKSEESMRAEAATLADGFAAEIQASAQASLQADAAAMGAGGASTEAINAAMQARVATLKADAQKQVEAKVQAALADRIAESRQAISDKANEMGAAMKATEEARLKPVGEAFDAMLNRVHEAVNAARKADTPERRAATELRVSLALKTADAFWAETRPALEANRSTLAAAKAGGNITRDADDMFVLWIAQRARLDQDLRAAMAAGDETGFVAATLAFQRAWAEMGVDAKRALGSKAPVAFDQLDGLNVNVAVNSTAMQPIQLPVVMPLPEIDVVPPVPPIDFQITTPVDIPTGPRGGFGPPTGGAPSPGATPPAGITLPPGMTMPPGLVPPTGGVIPAPGATPPAGFTLPPGFSIPPGFVSPAGPPQ